MDFYDSGSSSDEDLSIYGASFYFGRDISLNRRRLHASHRRGRDSPDTDILGEMMYLLTGDQSESLDVDDGATSDQMDTLDGCSAAKQPSSLIDLAAHATAKYCSSSELDGQSHPLDEALLRKVAYWSFPQDIRRVRAFAYMTDRLVNWRRAVKLVQDKKIKEMWQVGFMATAYLAKHSQGYGEPSTSDISRGNSEIRVSLLVERQRIMSSTCSECKAEVWCEHVIASIIHRIKYPDKVTVHAPMTETLSTLDRDQLQKLLQYAVNEDPAGILGKVFKHFNEIRDTQSEMNKLDGAPDPTYGGLQGEKSQWDLSLDLLSTRISADLDSMIRTRSYYDYSEGRSHDYYPDNFDLTMKMQSKFFSYITPVLEFIRQEEYLSAAEVMQRLISITAQKMRTTTRSDCPNLSRLWHDLSHIHALLVLRTEDSAARNVLLNAANKINVTAVMKDHILQTSDWSELPSLTNLFPAEAEKVNEGNRVSISKSMKNYRHTGYVAGFLVPDALPDLKTKGHILIESVLASQLQPYPDELRRLLDGTDSIEKTLYDEDLIVMLARLESVFYFERDRWYQKIIRLGFIILHKLAIQAQKDSVIGQFTGSPSSESDGGAPSSLIKLFCPGPPVSPSKQEEESPPSSSSTVEPMNTDSTPTTGKGRKTSRGPSKNKHPAKRFRSMAQIEKHLKLLRGFVWSSGHIAHAMLYTLRIIIASQKVSGLDSTNRKVLIGFCLQALELSRHRMHAVINSSNADSHSSHDPASQSETPMITQLEHDWCLKLETTVCDYLGLVGVDESHEAVSMYIDSISSIGTAFYATNSEDSDAKNNGGAYPLVLLEILCHLCTKNNALKESKSKQLVKICSEILLGSTNCQVYTSLLKEDVPYSSLRSSSGNKHIDFAVKKFHVIIETFLSLVGTDSSEDVNLLTMILKHLESLRNVALLKLIGKDLRMHVWRFKDDRRVVEAMLRFSIHSCQEVLGVSNASSAHASSSSAPLRLTYSQLFESRHIDSVEKEFIFSLVKKLDMSALDIFSKVWQEIFTCKDLQDLVLYLEVKDNDGNRSIGAGSSLAPEVRSIIDEFYDSKLSHDEDACTLLTRFFTSGSAPYRRIANKILANSENYHAGALFQLAKLQLSVAAKAKENRSITRKRGSAHGDTQPVDLSKSSDGSAPVDLSKASDDAISNILAPMDQKTFDIVEKAFERLGSTTATSSILDAVEWVFNSCVMCEASEQIKDITRLRFYGKLVYCVCHHAKSHRQVVLKTLQSIDANCGGISNSYLARHKSIAELGTTLIIANREYFGNRFKDCGHAAYAAVINEMLRARVDCKNFVPNGDAEFDKEVVESIRVMHSTKKKLIRMLSKDFPSTASPTNSN